MMPSNFSFRTHYKPSPVDWFWLLDRITPQMHNSLARHSYRILQNWYDVEDVMQESIIKSVLLHEQLRNEEKLLSWMFTIVRRESYSLLAKQSLYIPFDRLEIASPELLNNDLEEYWATAEKYSALVGYIREMDALTRHIIYLKATTDMNLLEIANYIGANYYTVRSRYYRALSALRKKLEMLDDYT